ncbi:hypothetical protein ACWGB8_34495 [Kitasatospora sp. NPDC054939]
MDGRADSGRPGGRRPLRVMADYDCHPLWFTAPDEVGDVAPDDPELGLSAELAQALDAWAARFDALLDRDDPAASDFESPAAERRFYADGEQLAHRVARELGPAWQVGWFDGRRHRAVPDAPA